MPTLRFRKSRSPIEVPAGTNLMKALLDGGLPVASSCRGDGVCAKCRVIVVDGAKNLSPQNEAEDFVRDRHEIPREERVSCQTTIEGDVTVDTAYW